MKEAAKGGRLPATSHDYGFAQASRVGAEALVAVLGNSYSVPLSHVGAPVTVRVHRERSVIWRDAEHLATHERAPDGARRRVVEPSHFAPMFGRKPRAQVMLYREALLGLGAIAVRYLSELSLCISGESSRAWRPATGMKQAAVYRPTSWSRTGPDLGPGPRAPGRRGLCGPRRARNPPRHQAPPCGPAPDLRPAPPHTGLGPLTGAASAPTDP